LPQVVDEGNGNGEVTGGVYKFSMNNAIDLVPDANSLRDGFQQDIVHAVVVGSPASLQQGNGTAAQQAVEDGLLRALGSEPYPVGGPSNGPSAQQFQQQQDEVAKAAAKFAALPAATRHAWLASNLTALKAGTITLGQLP
jgi:hypothetical protein